MKVKFSLIFSMQTLKLILIGIGWLLVFVGVCWIVEALT